MKLDRVRSVCATNSDALRCLAGLAACLVVTGLSPRPVFAEGKRLDATASANSSAENYAPELAIDTNENTLWVASLKPARTNNQSWFQLDFGSVKQVARLHWIAAQGTPYPASAPTEYRVLLSTNEIEWTCVPAPFSHETTTLVGDVLLNADARYVRLETTKVNDGSGWALGLREIWVTEGRDSSAAARLFRPRIHSGNLAATISWTAPDSIHPDRWNLFRADRPTADPEKPLVSLPGGARAHIDSIPNWTPRYYWLEAVDSRGKVLFKSASAAAVAYPAGTDLSPVETFAFWYEPYKPSTDLDASINHIGDAAFVVGPGVSAAADLARLGKGVLPYITFYQTAGWVGSFPEDANPKTVADMIAPVAFYLPSLRFSGSPPGYAPSVFCRPGNVEYSASAIQYTLCPNSSSLRNLALALVGKQLDGGALGFFVDNGYQDDVAASTRCESSRHTHWYGDDLTAADAFLGLLLEVRCEVKKRHPEGVVMVNGGVPVNANFYGLTLGDVCDGQLWESYLRSSYSTPKEHASNWKEVYRRSVALEQAWQDTPPQRMFVLSYPWDRDEAYFCYCTAKLCDLPWAASLGISDPKHLHFGGHFGTYPELVGLRLGTPAKQQEWGGVKLGEIYFRAYERGLVMVNPTRQPQTASVPLGKTRRWREVFSGIESEGSALSAQLPEESGRVFLWRTP